MKDIKYILICGAGLMGKNIAFVMASNPTYEVGVYDLYETDVAAGIRTNTKQLIAKGALTEEELASRLSRISFTTDLDSELVRRADLVILDQDPMTAPPERLREIQVLSTIKGGKTIYEA